MICIYFQVPPHVVVGDVVVINTEDDSYIERYTLLFITSHEAFVIKLFCFITREYVFLLPTFIISSNTVFLRFIVTKF